MAKLPTGTNRYQALLEAIFFDHYQPNLTHFEFQRTELETKAQMLNIALPRNLGDIVYSARYRSSLAPSILTTQPVDKKWIIEGAGRARYRFKLVSDARILPRTDLAFIDIPDATPEVIRAYAMDDEQALLAIVRYNRMVDIFLGLTTYSLQNHLRTTVKSVGQIEIDELYVGIDSRGCHYVIPVQAKGGKDEIGIVQTSQDILFVTQKFPGLRCRAISVQFMPNGIVAMFELTVQNDTVKIVEERHYRLVSKDILEHSAISNYR